MSEMSQKGSSVDASVQHTTAEWQALDRAHYLHPFTDSKSLGEKGTRVIERASGVYLWDSDGNKILDGMAGLWCVNLGYGRQELIAAATQQLQQLPFYNSFFQCTHPPAIALAELLSSVTPANLNHVFFTNSGSESIDTVVRMVRHYWQLQGEKDKTIIIGRHNAYHGSTMAGASLGGMKPMHAQGGLPIPGIEHIMQPHYYLLGAGMTPEAFGRKAAQALEDKIKQLGAHRVAAFVAEPIQGAGGVIMPPDSYWPEIQRICQQYDVLLVCDEVICGFGRTGKWFGSDYYGLRPDLMPIAKGLSSGYLPIGGVMVSDRVQAVVASGGEFFHGFTYSGHPAACAVAIATIQILQREGIAERVEQDVGPYLQQCLRQVFTDHPLVGEVQGTGLIAGIELTADKAAHKGFEPGGSAGLLCRDLCVANGLVMRAVGDRMVLAPPLVITRAEIDELVDKARRSIDAVALQFGVG